MKNHFSRPHLIVLLSLLSVTPATILGQVPDTLWTKTFGGDTLDIGRCVQQTVDGGYIVAGVTYSIGTGAGDAWLIKTDASGDTVWTKTLGGANLDEAFGVAQASDGGYIITGRTQSFGAGGADVWLIKTDASGDTSWTKTYGGMNNDYGQSVSQTQDGGFIVAGHTKSFGSGEDIWVIKTDANGDSLWTKTYGGSYYSAETGGRIQQTTDGGYIITGDIRTASGSASQELFLVKTDSSGNVTWEKTFDKYGNAEQGYSVCQTQDGGYIVTGYTWSSTTHLYLLKTDSLGNKSWDKVYGGSQNDGGSCVRQTTDGGYVIAGYTESFGAGGYDAWLLKTDAAGDTAWAKTFGGASSDYGNHVELTSDGGYILTGRTHSYGAGDGDIWLIRIEDIVPPSAPTTLSATPGDQQISLLWDANSEFDLHKYNIYRDTASPASTLIDSVVGSPPDTFYTDMGLSNGTTYYYRIMAVDDAGNESGYSEEVSAVPVGLVAYYPFNGNANDESANSNNGTVNGATLTTDRFGNVSNAYEFDSEDDDIDLGVASNFIAENSAFTISLWTKPYSYEEPTGDDRTFIGCDKGNYGYSLYYQNNDGDFVATTCANGSNTDYLELDENITPLNIWTHLTIRWDPEGFYTLFINGVGIDSVSTTQWSYYSGFTPHLFIGADQGLTEGSSHSTFHGVLDDFHIYNRVLNATEIDSLYRLSGWPGPAVATTSPIQNALDVALNSSITATFDQDIDDTTITAGNFVVHGSYTGLITGSYSSGTNTATLTPSVPFIVGEQISVILTTGIQDADNVPMPEPYAWSFTTAATAGNGEFVSGDTVGTGDAMAAGDIDADGDLDLIGVHRDSSKVIIYKNGGGNYTRTATIGVAAGLLEIVAGDFDNDGDIDITTNHGTSIYVLLNDGAGIFTQTSTLNVGFDIQIGDMGDFDGDGDLDIAGTEYKGSIIYILKNDGSGEFTTSQTQDFWIGISDVKKGDFDGDGDLDFAVTKADSSLLMILDNNGQGSFARIARLDIGTSLPASIVSSDFDGDGDPDLAIVKIGSDEFIVLKNNGGVFTLSSTVSVGDEPRIIISGDIDADGDLDLAVGNTPFTGDHSYSILENDGSGSFTPTVLLTAPRVGTDAGLSSTGFGDTDGDGDLDLIATNANSSTISLFSNDPPPAAPSGLTATPAVGQIALDWLANSEEDLYRYNIYRDTSSPATTLIDSMVGSPPDTVYTDTDVTYSNTYYYRITALDTAWNESGHSAEVSETPDPTPFEADSLALVALYNSTDGPNWTDRSGWLSADTALTDWYGVTVSGGRVTELSLIDNNLTGSISPEIGSLSNLSYLDLSVNQLSGSIPAEISNLTNLTYLHFGANQLSGSIPVEIGSLSNLTELLLYDNQLSGSIPAELGGLTNLDTLWLSHSQLSGSIPVEIGSLTNLTYLHLGVNQLSGSIPVEFGSLTNLTHLYLSYNQLSGPLPVEFGNLTNLTYLYLEHNQLSGSIPVEFGNLTNLVRLAVSYNQLSGSIPDGLGNLTNLYRLYLEENQFTSLPDLNSLTGLDRLYVHNNRLIFSDIEPNIGLGAPGCAFAYAPQDSVGVEQDTSVQLGTDLTLEVSVGGASTQVQWKKDGATVTGVTSDSTYTITGIDSSDAGSYICVATNTVATDLTLYSRPIQVSVIDTLTPAIPVNLTATPGDGLITLTWDANSEPDLAKYRIFRDTSSPAVTLVDSVTGTPPGVAYTDGGVSNFLTYYYRIKAVDTDGNASDFSAEASAMPMGQPPAAPVLASPTDGAVQQDIRPALSWSASPEADSYHLQVATSAAFSTLVFDTDSIAGTSRQVGPLASGQTYYWRVRGENVAGLGDYSSEWSFTTRPPFDAPAVVIVDSFDVPGSSPTGLAWDGGSLWMIDNLENIYQLDTTGAVLSSFASSYTASGLTWDGDHLWLHTTGYKLVALTPQGDYVRELDVGYHPYSGMAWDGRYFWVGNYNNGDIHKHNPDGSEVLYFSTGFFGHPTGMDYNGGYLLIGDSFELYNRIYKYSTTGQELINFNLNDVGLTGDPADQKKLAWDGRYLWYTSDARFKIYKLSIPYYHAAPLVPTLLAPANGAEVDSLKPVLSWNPSQDAAGYQLQVADNPGFDPTVYDNAGLTAPAVQMDPLGEDVTYYWRVRAQNSAGTSAYTSAWSFHIPDLTPPDTLKNLVATPGYGEITLAWSANTEPDLAQYRIYRDVNSPANTLIDSVLGVPPGTSYIDTNVSYTTVYYYRLTAMDVAGNEGGFSNEVSATPLSPLHADSMAVVAFYNSTNGENWTNKTNWLSPDSALDTWHGVTVSGGRVTGVNLYQNNLSGTLPPEIGNLTALTYLYLSNEPLTGQLTGSIPPEIGNLVALESLELRGHQLSGAIPVEIGNLTSLNILDLAYNSLNGPLPAALWALTNMTFLDLGGNQFTGSIPAEIGNLINLTNLYLNQNQLNGPIPVEIGYLANLSLLWLSLNQLSGPIPSEIFTLTQMVDLRLRNNSLSGSIPAAISNMPGLSILDLRWNQFAGPIPDEITSLADLGLLSLNGNQFTSLPSLESLTALDYLNIEENRFTFKDIEPNANLPTVTSFTYAPQDSVGIEIDTTVYVGSDLTLEFSVGGTVALNTYTWEKDGTPLGSPIEGDSTYTIVNIDFADAGSYACSATNDSLPGLTLYSRPIHVSVEYTPLQQDSLALVALYNSTNGENWTNKTNWLSPDSALDTWYGVTASGERVTGLDLYQNNLSGTIPPEIGDLTALAGLNLNNNLLSGPVPASIGNMRDLVLMELGNNSLEGSIPAEIGNLSQLEELNLYSNQLSGTIPEEIWNLTQLLVLDLYSNNLSGSIPPALGDLSALVYLGLGYNSFTGPIPAEIGNLVNLTSLHLGGVPWGGVIPPEIGNLTNLTELTMSYGELGGSIPVEIGNLTSLIRIYLDHTQLSGVVPGTIRNLTNLEDLLLQNCQFTGLPDLAPLTSLQQLQVQNNRLTFSDIEPNVGVPSHHATYAPQDSVGVEIDTTVYVGSDLTLEFPVGGTVALNTYTWKQDGNPLGSPITGDSTYTLTGIDFTAAGSYTCSATNDSLPDLTLYGRPIHVTVIDSVPPEPPVGLAAAPAYEQITLSWSPNSEDDLSHYLVYQGLASGFDTTGALVAQVNQPDTAAIITGLNIGTTYYFRLVAVDTWGNVSRLSAEASAAPVAYPVLVASTDPEWPIGWHDPEVTFTFDLPLDPATITSSSVIVGDNSDRRVPYDIGYLIPQGNEIRIDWSACLVSGDTITITLAADHLMGAAGQPIDGNEDGVPDGSPEDDIVRTYTVASYADFDTSGTIDFDDLATFTAGWYGEDLACELGPVTGTVPHLIMTPDDDFNLRDLMTFIRMWDWYSQFATPLAKVISPSNTLDLNVMTDGQRLMVGLDAAVSPAAVHLQIKYAPDELQATPDSSRTSYGLQLQRVWPGEGILEIDAALPGERAEVLAVPVRLDIQGRDAVSVGIYLEAVDRNGQLLGTAEEMVEVKPVPTEFALHQNYPNPFNPSTTMEYDLPAAGDVTLIVYDLRGREVIRLVDGYAEAGYYQAIWQGRSSVGGILPSGIYLVRLTAREYAHTIKTVLLK